MKDGKRATPIKKRAPTKSKTPDQIMQANLRHMLTKLKHTVADREEIWYNVVMEVLPALASQDSFTVTGATYKASQLADAVLEEYETRWGQGGSKIL